MVDFVHQKGTYLCFDKILFYVPHYEGFGAYTEETCRVHYLQQG